MSDQSPTCQLVQDPPSKTRLRDSLPPCPGQDRYPPPYPLRPGALSYQQGSTIAGTFHPRNPAKTPGFFSHEIMPRLRIKTVRNNPWTIANSTDEPQTLGFSRPLCHPARNMNANGKSRIWRKEYENQQDTIHGPSHARPALYQWHGSSTGQYRSG